MKVAVITLNGDTNLGNRLQNYAVQSFLEMHGSKVSTIIYQPSVEKENALTKIKVFINSFLCKTGISDSEFFVKYIKKSNRMLLCKKFDKKYISHTKKYIFKRDKMEKYQEDFDYYSVGSDQVWNCSVVENNDFFFLKFAPKEKTFSFSASMGTTYVPKEYMDNYIKGLNHIGHISVRENEVKEFIKDTVNRESTVLLDPTLLLSKEKWSAIASPPDFNLPSGYIATYFLSPITESQKKYIDEYAKLNNLTVIDIGQSYYEHVGPLEFIYLIANANFIFTDSFHGTAFSLIFDKDFLVFQRNKMYDMSSRIITILKKFELEIRFPNWDNNSIDDTFFDLIEEIKKQDTSKIKEILSKEQALADTFIKKVFSKEV